MKTAEQFRDYMIADLEPVSFLDPKGRLTEVLKTFINEMYDKFVQVEETVDQSAF